MSGSDTGDGGIYEPLLPPLQDITPQNRGPIALATAVTLLVISSLTVGVKLWTRYATTRNFGSNDIVMFAAITLAYGQTISISLAVDKGLGRHQTAVKEPDLIELSKLFYASNILLVLALACAKAAVTLLIIAIKPLRWVMFACYGMLGFVAVWGVASVFVVAFQCSPNHWSLGPSSGADPQTCIDQYAMQIALRAMDIASDVGIVLLPALMMRSVQVSNGKRWMVVTLFAIRLATPVFTAVSIVAYDDFYHSVPQDRTWHAVTPSVWTSCALNLSIVTACIPSIKRFLADWAAGLSAVTISEPFELEHSAGKTGAGLTYAAGSGMGSKIATKLGLSSTSKAEITSTVRSRSDNEDDETVRNTNRNRSRGAGGRQPDNTSESVKGLTDGVIMHSIDYRVEYEDHTTDHRDWSSRSSGGR
ncbi:uncharacterized protein PV07_09406 [Cladophialophora immunda]|uniref:Rhodopsin domain-containing protein n=1 Tax=Cladophialophora immunda TaxID=569365 RepID=A0A0D2C714_9EURO|nr:uncharacterized protein PV07_09406 [Cladophialophora immunda]KIW26305.1 hypothetical protein PV07_09406 [Cladophialophora immunda]OQV10412.1 hypothetical protein CLAIMM_14414 [Cladophialophora immunda]